VLAAGLPDAVFVYQKYQFIKEGLGIDNFGIFYGHLVFFGQFW
jgi:hypothetical protein